jgi:hypothetical protein
MKEIGVEEDQYMRKVISIVENCMQHSGPPTIILGSGASAAHGIHTMDSLALEIIRLIEEGNLLAEHELAAWEIFKDSLDKTKNLEKALEDIENQESLVRKISIQTWSLIHKSDNHVFSELLNENQSLPLSDIISSLTNGIGSTAHLKIITTNYDRLAEYACDCVQDNYCEYIHYTGFSYGLIRKADEQFSSAGDIVSGRALYNKSSSFASRLKPIEILKVHGSIDWFEKQDGEIIALSSPSEKPDNMIPAIITPGKGKFKRTHDHPFSMIVGRAKQVLETSSSFLVIGFGFRDEHIHNNLVKQIRNQKAHKSFVVLAKELTVETKSLFLKNENIENYVLFEEYEKNATKIYKKDRNSEMEEFVLKGHSLWDSKQFYKFFLTGR